MKLLDKCKKVQAFIFNLMSLYLINVLHIFTFITVHTFCRSIKDIAVNPPHCLFQKRTARHNQMFMDALKLAVEVSAESLFVFFISTVSSLV